VLIKNIVQNEEKTIINSVPHQKPIAPLKHKVQCGGGTFEIYTHYELVRNIGNGAFGFVCSGKDKLNNVDVAIKKV
jgi:mitogen-activated protein kinase 1/3